ncbi:MAG: hypothetical protein ACKPGB_11530 [Dolichospermum sp.]
MVQQQTQHPQLLKEWKDKYKQLLTTTNKQIDQLTTERDELLNKQETGELFIDEPSRARADLLRKVSDLTVDRDTALQLVEGYKKTVLELTIANRKLTDEVNELRGETILKELETQTEEDPRQDPRFLEDTRNQEIVANFLEKLDRITRVDKLTWKKIKELPLNSKTMQELILQVKSKTHKYLLEQMPAKCAKYIEQTGDSSDLDWLPKDFVELVQKALLVTEETTPF